MEQRPAYVTPHHWEGACIVIETHTSLSLVSANQTSSQVVLTLILLPITWADITFLGA